MILLMLGLFGALALGTLALDSVGNENSDGEELPPEESGQEPSQNNTHLLEFTAGNDSVEISPEDFAGISDGSEPLRIDLLGGDDIAEFGFIDRSTVLGGDGSDLITLRGPENILDGGAGNDTLSADDGNTLRGGTGDDVLNFDHHPGGHSGGEGWADGGEGNDTITAHTDALAVETGLSGVHMRGGDGADELRVVYDLGANAYIDDDGSSYAYDIAFDARYVTVEDFNPAEDRLIVEVDRDPTMAERGVSLDFDQTEADGVYTTLLKMTFAATADMPAGTNTLTIMSNSPFGLEDIQFVDSLPVGQELAYNGSSLLEGTEGDDTLPAGQNNSLAPEEIDLLGGNDVAVIEEQIGVGVFGGAGNDSLTSRVVGNGLHGGDGNDTLAGIDGNDMYGDAGDDLITFEGDVQLGDMTAHINGGAGNDTINIMQDAGVNHDNLGGAIVEGGEGADAFNYVIDLQNSLDEPGNLQTTLAPIRDFNPNEDMLSIQVDKSDLAAGRDVTIAMEQTEVNGTFTSQISLTFAGTADASQAVAYLEVTSNVAFTLEDIQFVNV